jgi:hypothetical protein
MNFILTIFCWNFRELYAYISVNAQCFTSCFEVLWFCHETTPESHFLNSGATERCTMDGGMTLLRASHSVPTVVLPSSSFWSMSGSLKSSMLVNVIIRLSLPKSVNRLVRWPEENTRKYTGRRSVTIKGVGGGGGLLVDLRNYLHGLSVPTGTVVYMWNHIQWNVSMP